MEIQLKELRDIVQQMKREIAVNSAEKEDLKNDIMTLRQQFNQEFADLKGKDNGTLVWRIADFKKKQQEEIEGTEAYILSEPFRMRPYGYEMEAQLFLNGHKIGSNSHLSAYIHFRESDLEPTIIRPFFYSIQLTLLDQSDRPSSEKVDIVWNWEPYLNSVEEQLSSSMVYGAPTFVPLSILERDTYLRNDTLFFKAEVRPLVSVMRDYFSNDGTLTWVIDNFSQRRLDEAEGMFSWPDSKKFYSAPIGRRLGAVIKFNYDGDNGPGDNLGIFVKVYKGEFDSQLPPTFPIKITYKIVNQSRSTENDMPDLINTKTVDYEGMREPGEIASKMSTLVDTHFPHEVIEKEPYMIGNRIVIKLVVEPL